MRPEILYNLFTPITSIKGVGANTSKLLSKLAGGLVRDLLFHLPIGMIQRHHVNSIAQAALGQTITVILTAELHQPPTGGKGNRPYRVSCKDERGLSIDLVFFRVHQDYLLKQLPLGVKRVVSGALDSFNQRWQITHPDHIGPVEDLNEWIGIEPVYPLTQGITQKYLSKIMKQVLQRCPELPEWITQERLSDMKWPTWQASIKAIHSLQEPEMLSPHNSSRRRLAYDELFANQLALLLIRQRLRGRAGQTIQGDQLLRQKLINILPYKLTGAQQRALSEIYQDMAEPHRMVRLLQGDVGSGKTVVAMLAMLNAVEAGYQAALLAPTEILASQHYDTLQNWAAEIGVRIALLTGKSKNRTQVLQALEQGHIDIIIGTHAIIQEDITFKNLGFAVVDEQHRFGVEQRLKLSQKGEKVDTLVMTATPIPRTLMLAAYGDLATSILDEKPAGRQEIETKISSSSKLKEVIEGVGRAINRGQKTYWVCPLVEESEVLDLAAAQERYEQLTELFPSKVGLIHGRMKVSDKDQVMGDFLSGKYQLLVATTVIEVGVHVPDATIMIIEHAERFGLSQLHQLRGRIGRGDQQSTCLLLYEPPLSESAQIRLNIMRETNDGFRIAEEDFRLRGGGDILGLRQSGMPSFKLVNPEVHMDLLPLAHKDVQTLLHNDPYLQSSQGQAAKVLLYLFEKDKTVKLLESG